MMSAILATGVGENAVNHSAAIAFAKKGNDPLRVTTLPIKLSPLPSAKVIELFTG